jgi:hypothetical protein
MMPLITRRSSTRRAPGWFVGKSGSIAAQARSESQNPADTAHLSRITRKSESDKAKLINRLIGF